MHKLEEVQSPEDWANYHGIRQKELFEPYGDPYDDNHPDDKEPNHYNLLLKFNDVAIGTVRLDHIDSKTAIVRLVAISGSFQRQGHGRALQDLIEVFAKSVGVEKLFVNAEPDSLEYYRKMGWQEYDWDPSQLVDIATNCKQMKKHI